MEASAFDRFTRAVSRAGTRRRLLGLVASLSLGGMLAAGQEGRAAERPLDRLQQRTPQRNRRQRQNHENSNNPKRHNGKNEQPGTSPDCVVQCERDHEFCVENCEENTACLQECGRAFEAYTANCPDE